MNSNQYEQVSDDDKFEQVSEDEVEIQFKQEVKKEIKEEIKEEQISIISISSFSTCETESGDDYEVEEVLAERRKHNQTEYLVKFEGNFLKIYN